MAEPTNEPDRSAHLASKVNAVGTQFLLTEIQAGMALVDTADASRDDAANERRRALALEAYDVVAERLARTGADAVTLSAAEREELTQAHAELGRRLGR